MIRTLFAAVASLLVATASTAQAPADRPIDQMEKQKVITELATAMRDNYVFPDRAGDVAAELERRSAAGEYAAFATAQAFADKLREDLRALGDDRHLQFRFRPGIARQAPSRDERPNPEEMQQFRREMAENGYGIYRTARLPGNISYIDVRFFGPPEFVSPAYEAAMQLVDGSDALIIDLRANGGGDPASVVQLVSHLFPVGDSRHINSIYNREEDRTREFWTNPTVVTRFGGPVYVLTSSYTFSGGEEFAYDLKTQERATLIGETTGGGANPGGMFPVANDFAAFIPTGRAINPVTGTNWEHVGVAPDIEATAEAAISVAYVKAIEEIGKDAEEQRKQELARVKARHEKGEIDLPGWVDPRTLR